jgi:hypothetical protein
MIVSTVGISENQTAEIALYAAFFMEGLRDRDYDAVIASWDQGCLSWCRNLCSLYLM